MLMNNFSFVIANSFIFIILMTCLGVQPVRRKKIEINQMAFFIIEYPLCVHWEYFTKAKIKLKLSYRIILKLRKLSMSIW